MPSAALQTPQYKNLLTERLNLFLLRAAKPQLLEIALPDINHILKLHQCNGSQDMAILVN